MAKAGGPTKLVLERENARLTMKVRQLERDLSRESARRVGMEAALAQLTEQLQAFRSSR